MPHQIPRSATPHADVEFRPLPWPQRSGIALCLSGGGFRAALFHLGALRRLNEVGILPQVTTVTGVSGGSIMGAFLAEHLPWPKAPLPDAEWDARVALPFRAFAARNLGTAPVALGYLAAMTNAGINLLASRCEQRLTRLMLQQLPVSPRYIFGATDLISGKSRAFDRDSVERWPVAKAVAISSCYPGFFPAFHQAAPERLSLVDGGVDDDHAVEPVWRTHEILLVSDGGNVFHASLGESFAWTLARSGAVIWNQLREVRKRWLIENFITGEMAGTYWAIDSSAAHYGPAATTAVPGYSAALARDVLGNIRTAYDAFSEGEIAALENHGYFVTEAATRTHLQPLRRVQAPLKAPHPAWMSERKVKDALRSSANWWPPRW
jgi:NTE family protein